jgi:Ca2+-binding RTX toxin-like protein
VNLGDIDSTALVNNIRDYNITGLTTNATGSNTVVIEQQAGASNARDLDWVRLVGTGSGVAGNDTLLGGGGNDRLFGMGGNDTLTGGTGVDKFIYSANFNNGNDTVTDFEVGIDKIVLADLLPLANAAAQAPNLVNSPTIALTDLVSSAMTSGHAAANQAVTWNDATHTLTFGWGGSVTFTGLATSYASANAFLTANGILTADGFNNNI